MAPVLEADNLWKSFDRRPVLRGVDVALGEGEVAVLVGANGSGKTTLLRCLSGLCRPDRGCVRLFGRPVREGSQRARLGLVGHESYLYPQLTARENLQFAARMCGLRRPQQRVDELLDRTGLAPWADRPAGQLSRGMRQRLSLARALVHRPSVLLLDEPFTGLDAGWTEWLVRLLAGLRADGCCVFLATHRPESCQAVADRVLRLERGRLVQERRSAEAVRGLARQHKAKAA